MGKIPEGSFEEGSREMSYNVTLFANDGSPIDCWENVDGVGWMNGGACSFMTECGETVNISGTIRVVEVLDKKTMSDMLEEAMGKSPKRSCIPTDSGGP